MHFVYIASMLITILGPLVKMVLRMIGFGFVTYIGINLIINQAKDYIISQAGSAGPTIINILGIMKFDVAVNIMLAAVTTRFILSGMDKIKGSKSNSVWTPPGKSGGSIDA